MRDPMDDYRKLVRLPVGHVSIWMSKEFPQGVHGQWISAMLDIAITDYYAANEPPGATPYSRIQLAATLLDFASKHQRIREIFIAEWYMKFSKKAIEGWISEVPPSMTADSVVRYSLDCFQLTQEKALAVAQTPSGAGQSSLGSEPGRPDGVPSMESRLSGIRFLLRDMTWFVDKVSDADLKHEVLSWLEIREHLWPSSS
jgi:hypothetical protein